MLISLYKKAYAGLSPSTWLLAVVLLINRSGTMVIPFMTVYLTQRLHFSIEQAGWVMACFGIGAVVGAFMGGRFSDRIGFYQVQFWSLFLQGLLFIVLGQMHTLPQICICIFVLSSVGESFRPANSAATAHYSLPENQTRSYALNRLAVNLGWSVGPAIGGLLAGYSYNLLFWVDGCTCMAAVLIMRLLLPPVKVVHKEKQHHSTIKVKEDSVYKDGVYLVFILLVTIFSVGFFQFNSIVPLYMAKVLQMKEVKIGAILGVNGLIIALVEMVMVYKLEGRRHPLLYVTAGVVLGGLSYILFNVLPLAMAASASFVLFATIGEMLCIPFMNSFWVGRSKPHNRGQYASLYTVAFALCSIIAPTLGGYMVEHYGFTTWWYLTAGACASTGAGFYLIYRKLTDVQSPVSNPL